MNDFYIIKFRVFFLLNVLNICVFLHFKLNLNFVIIYIFITFLLSIEFRCKILHYSYLSKFYF